ncbi:hypothetical protein CJU94_32845 [Paraburkholderia aromaticivorans]|uniref:Chemotaxis protein n=1 Tax=Paraburkholderia aromaticivorans TaxID=2026199 RepID=A0A248VVB7_9BURK|nr:hypothetical protein [Paraburkholderia aromaticivorans]ASW02823.1 hypothetical protein CJU94_32845 [Paraburkholderia aromaticivorans]
MANRHFPREGGRLTHRAYTLRPARSLGFRVVVWAVACALCVCAGAAGFAVWHARRAGTPLVACSAAPVEEGEQQIQLTRARLALAEESAARAAVQKTADSAAAEVARLDAELQFLRGQSKGGSAARTEAAGR